MGRERRPEATWLRADAVGAATAGGIDPLGHREEAPTSEAADGTARVS